MLSVNQLFKSFTRPKQSDKSIQTSRRLYLKSQKEKLNEKQKYTSDFLQKDIPEKQYGKKVNKAVATQLNLTQKVYIQDENYLMFKSNYNSSNAQLTGNGDVEKLYGAKSYNFNVTGTNPQVLRARTRKKNEAMSENGTFGKCPYLHKVDSRLNLQLSRFHNVKKLLHLERQLHTVLEKLTDITELSAKKLTHKSLHNRHTQYSIPKIATPKLRSQMCKNLNVEPKNDIEMSNNWRDNSLQGNNKLANNILVLKKSEPSVQDKKPNVSVKKPYTAPVIYTAPKSCIKSLFSTTSKKSCTFKETDKIPPVELKSSVKFNLNSAAKSKNDLQKKASDKSCSSKKSDKAPPLVLRSSLKLNSTAKSKDDFQKRSSTEASSLSKKSTDSKKLVSIVSPKKPFDVKKLSKIPEIKPTRTTRVFHKDNSKLETKVLFGRGTKLDTKVPCKDNNPNVAKLKLTQKPVLKSTPDNFNSPKPNVLKEKRKKTVSPKTCTYIFKDIDDFETRKLRMMRVVRSPVDLGVSTLGSVNSKDQTVERVTKIVNFNS